MRTILILAAFLLLSVSAAHAQPKGTTKDMATTIFNSFTKGEDVVKSHVFTNCGDTLLIAVSTGMVLDSITCVTLGRPIFYFQGLAPLAPWKKVQKIAIQHPPKWGWAIVRRMGAAIDVDANWRRHYANYFYFPE